MKLKWYLAHVIFFPILPQRRRNAKRKEQKKKKKKKSASSHPDRNRNRIATGLSINHQSTKPTTMSEPSSPIGHRAFARVGFLGNPSDVYFGRAISFSVANFFASVHLQPSDDLVIRPHRTHDLANFRSLVHLVCPPIFLKPPEVWNSWR